MIAPAIDFPWLRRIKVTFSGLALATDSVTFTGAGKTVSYECDGTQQNVRVVAKVHKVIQGLPDATNLMLWNLSPDTRNYFVRGRTKVRIEAGWDYGPFAGLRQCFYGSFVNSVSMRAGPDIVTSINAISAVDDLALTPVNEEWSAGVPVRTIVNYLASLLAGVALDNARIKGFDDRKIGPGGWSCCGTVRGALNALSSEFGFSWTICDGYFQAVGDEKSLGGITGVRDPYLIDINPVFTGPGMEQAATGLRIRCAFNATVDPMFRVSVESQIEPRYNGGGYTVQTVDHDLGCFPGDNFMTAINAKIDEEKARVVNGL